MKNLGYITYKYTNPEYYETKICIRKTLARVSNTVLFQNHINTIFRQMYKIFGAKENIPATVNNQYYTFKIPKKTHGFREINAPTETLKNYQTKIKNTLELTLHPHNSAYAYVKNRSHIDALKRHQENNSKWFLKLDIKNFFPSCTKELILKNLQELYFVKELNEETRPKLEYLIDICCKDNALPQGAPSSPTISNIIFTKYDKQIENLLHFYSQNFTLHGKQMNFVYTRYADDIIISAKNEFKWKKLQQEIQKIFENDFIINAEKTRYGSSAGRNWNLGLMLNKDNNITVGYREKRRIKAAIFNLASFTEDYTTEERQQLAGEINYAKQVEPEYFEYLLQKYSKKLNKDLKMLLKP